MLKTILAAALGIASLACHAADHSTATIRAEYRYEYASPHSDSLRHRTDVMALQIAPDESRFFSVKTEFFDSLSATPGGPQMIQQQMMDALNNSGAIKRDAGGGITSITIDKSSKAFDNVPQKGVTVNVYKHHDLGVMNVYDLLRGPDDTVYTYDVPMNDIDWEPGDSATTILGYECQNATAMYHGRRWTAWFAPDIASSEGPWQLHGLPGLILMAESDGGEYRFTITGLYEYTEKIKDMPGERPVERTTRREFLINTDDLTRNPGKAYGIPGPAGDIYHDLIETDYRQ